MIVFNFKLPVTEWKHSERKSWNLCSKH